MQYKAKFMDTERIKYLVTSSQTESPAFHKATALSAKNPDAEIRVVIHTGTLGGYNLGKTFRERIQRFVERWDVMLENVCLSFIGKEGTPLRNNIEIYAVLPALGSEHNVVKPLFFNHKTTTCYQKREDGGYSFDYTDPEGLLSSIEELLQKAA